MCALPPAWLWLLLGLLPLELQARAASLRHRRLTLPRSPNNPKSSLRSSTATATAAAAVPTESNLAMDNRIPGGAAAAAAAAQLTWPRPRLSALHPSRDWPEEAPALRPRGSRGRRHANGGGGWAHGHGHLMRVGCVLGTCQVQNLSHRLYQLIGQSGREDSSPINPRSPHSYG